MKNIITMNPARISLLKHTLSFILFVFCIGTPVLAQPWTETLPQDREAKAKLTLFDYQKAFNNYWEPYQVEEGYFMVNGEKQKAGGWKHFKRWEWFWESRVNPQTGEFPNTSAQEEFRKYLEINGGGRSLSGNWSVMGPNSSTGGYAGIGRLNCVAFSPNDNDVIYVGAAAGGVWKTTDGGTNWIPTGDFNDALGTSDIAVVGTASDDILYLATGDRDHSDTYSVGVLKSTDGGTTWDTTALSWTQSQGYLIYRLLVSPVNSSLLYAATNGGVYKTTNAGGSWTQITTLVFKDLEFNPGNSSTIYGSTGWGQVYRSTNSGSTWAQVLSVSSGRRTELAVSEDNNARVYAIIANTSSALYGIYKSTDNGGNFAQVFSGSTANLLDWSCDGSGSGGQGWYDLCIISDPNNADVVFIGGVNTWKSTNAGSSWTINNHWSSTCGGLATTVHADKHFLAYQNGTSTLFECNDGGIYKTTNSGGSWTDISNTLVIGQMYRLGVAQTVSDDVITGLQDNGTKNFETDVWEDVIGGDGMECIIDYTNANTQYGELYYGNIKRTTDHWANYTTISNGIGGNGAWVTPYVIDPNSNQTLYVGYNDVWKSTNQGNSWVKISNWGGNTLRSLAIAPSNSNYIYAATYSTIYKTDNGGSSWSNITSGLPVATSSLTYIAVKDDDPNTVWVSFGGFNSDGVYQTTNGGSSWTNISGGLPLLPVNCVIQNKLNTSEEEIYAGTDVGVYVKNGSANWAAFYDSLPNVVVNELDIYYDTATPSNSLIRAATFGRGLWESDLYSPVLVPVADFVADTLTPSTTDTVHFTDLSSNNPTSWFWEFSPSGITYQDSTDENSQNPVVIFDSAGFYTVTLTATNSGGSDTVSKIDYIEVSLAVPLTDFVADTLTPLTTDTVHFTDLSSNNPTSWFWEFEPSTITYQDSTDANSQHPIVLFDSAALYTVSLTATNAGGSNTETKTDYIDVSDALSVVASADPDEVCMNDTTQLNADASGGSGNYTFSWTSVPVGFVSDEQNPVAAPEVTTVYTVEVSDGADMTYDDVEVVVNELPQITLGDWPDILCNQEEPPVQLTADPTGGVYSGNVTEDGIFTSETAPLGWNVIAYTFEDSTGCENSAQDSIFVDQCVGVGNVFSEENINIYPNPNDGKFVVESSDFIISVEIINQLGEVVFAKNYNRKRIEIEADLKKGIYYIRLTTKDGSVSTKKIVVY
ncbi:MAG: PKD domain-containing protein [Bacteroidales bacterium]|nr:PKD domain-containing protein [Bacteroidales bacterium]